jgi:hypothetical protein
MPAPLVPLQATDLSIKAAATPEETIKKPV